MHQHRAQQNPAQTSNSYSVSAPLKALPRKSVEGLTGLSRSSIYAMMATGDFPRNFRVTSNAVRWFEHEVVEWLKQKAANR